MIHDVVTKVGTALTPPGIDPNTWWRIAVSGTLTAVVAILLLHLAHACGWGPFAGEGFAQAADVDKILATLKEEQIFEQRVRHCQATDPDARRYRLERLNMLLGEYRELTGNDYPLPECGEL